jgi:hypothetical protein
MIKTTTRQFAILHLRLVVGERIAAMAMAMAMAMAKVALTVTT